MIDTSCSRIRFHLQTFILIIVSNFLLDTFKRFHTKSNSVSTGSRKYRLDSFCNSNKRYKMSIFANTGSTWSTLQHERMATSQRLQHFFYINFSLPISLLHPEGFQHIQELYDVCIIFLHLKPFFSAQKCQPNRQRT